MPSYLDELEKKYGSKIQKSVSTTKPSGSYLDTLEKKYAEIPEQQPITLQQPSVPLKRPTPSIVNPFDIFGLGMKPLAQYLQKEEEVTEKKVKPWLRKREVPFVPKESMLRYFPGAVAAEFADWAKPSTLATMYAGGKLLGAAGSALGKTKAGAFLAKKAPHFFKTADDLAYQQWLKNPRISPSPKTLIARQQEPGKAINKIIRALKEARPIRGKQELLYSIEREKRLGAISEIGKKIPGEKGYYEQLSKLKGELPKVQFTGIRNKISQLDIDSLFMAIENSEKLYGFEKITAKRGLSRLLGAEGGKVPTEGELRLLSQVFPKNLIGTILSKRSILEKMGQGIAEVLNVPRALMASFDMSAPFRQGIFLMARHPGISAKNMGSMFKYFFSEKAYQGGMKDIHSRVTYPLMKRYKLPLTEIGKSLTAREEAFMGAGIAERIPFGVGKVVRASNRAYTGFLNKLRADTFDYFIKSAQQQGIKVKGKIGHDIARFIGSATGRGSLGGLERAAVSLNTVLFSPRLWASRMNLLNPRYYARLDPFVRKEALKSLFAFTGMGMSFLGLAKAGGAEVGTDWRSTDFGKIKIGNTRIDVWGGFQQYARLAGQLISGKYISSTTGIEHTLGEGYKPLTRLGIVARFARGKLSPVTSFALSLMEGKTYLGRDVEIPKEIGLRLTPMVIQDMYDLYQEGGLPDMAMGIPAIFGVGVQTYGPDAQSIVGSANSVIDHMKQLTEQGRLVEARKLWLKNQDIVKIGKKLEPLQKDINKIKKGRLGVIKNIRFTPEQKKKFIISADKKIKELQETLNERFRKLKRDSSEFKKGQIMQDAEGNRTIVYPDGTYEKDTLMPFDINTARPIKLYDTIPNQYQNIINRRNNAKR